MSVVERHLLYGDEIFCHGVFWGENICLLFSCVHFIEVYIH